MRKTIAVIYGGKSAEHEVSVISGKSIAKNLDPKKFKVLEIFIDKKGFWFRNRKKLPAEQCLKNIDVAFPVLHGTYGEDGTIQGLFEMLNIPYAGCGVSGSALGMDKEFSKTIWKKHGLPVVEFKSITKSDWKKSKNLILKEISRLKFPLFIKPANLGSSIGITKIKSGADLEKAISFAFTYGYKVMVEEGLKDAREIEVSLLGNDIVTSSVCGEIIPANEFYDYDAKYNNPNSKALIPAKIDKKTSAQIKKTAEAAYKALNLDSLARADFLLSKKTGKLVISEINTMPGFTPISMFPKLWEATGISYQKLLTKLVELAEENFREKSRFKV